MYTKFININSLNKVEGIDVIDNFRGTNSTLFSFGHYLPGYLDDKHHKK